MFEVKQILVKALDVLEKYFGYKSFRKGQLEIVNTIIEGNDVVSIMPTGGGKSICYQVPVLLLEGITIVISPLISLMKDQVDSLKENGINALYINSSLSSKEFNKAIEEVKNDEYKIIYVAPERLESYEFISVISQKNISQIAIDEAHCVSQWGHDFRSSYRRISSFIDMLQRRPVVTSFTATATEEVREDIIKLLRLNNPEIFISGFDRENLKIDIVKAAPKNKYLLEYLKANQDVSGIIYAATRKEVDSIFELLLVNGFNAGRYHAGMSDVERAENQEKFIYDKTDIMVATNAFGMGIDKPNIRYVIHYNMPKNIEGYYQEIGRAGRDGLESECVMLFTPGDVHTQKYLIEMSTENPQRKSLQYKMLQSIVDLVHSNSCYRKYILNYFGENYLGDCGKCSNCNNLGELIDKTLDAQKVLSCIYRMRRSFGATVIIDVLRGSNNKKILDLEFNKLSTYGIMKNYSKDELKNFINTLISHGFIDSVEGTYPVIKLNDKSFRVLKGTDNVTFKEVKIKAKAMINDNLLDKLKLLRRLIAQENKIPPYLVFGDETLKEMSVKIPKTKEEMLNISGVGEVKYDRYGEKFIKEILDYVKETAKSPDGNDKEKKVLEISTDEELYLELVKLRGTLAEKEGQLPQYILSRNTLKEISGRYPNTLEKLKDIGGIGNKKLELYGEKIIALVNNYVAEKKLEVEWYDKGSKKTIIDGEERKIEEMAVDFLKEGKEIEDISKELEVSISTILGYVTDFILAGNKFEVGLELDKFIKEGEEKLIIDACDKLGYKSIIQLKKHLPNEIKYEAIRAVILKKYIVV
ncbi:DNA helicase RecQ [Clostridium sp. YIM B02551]|uniref:DNA helicase RecQ n=1 Tax=Clostridium sp. YIM B02551 TaxID=2910679 RepID=UPI0023AF68BD|nr:DNA helicase RecQ [Clostridium sp. YIM B02551]